jgi:Zn-finger nucleic acid-binding protein
MLERCKTCFGLFFDLGELESLLEHSVTEKGGINHAYLNNINADYYQTKQAVKYIKCPVCQAFMRRTNFGRKSGVIIDSCRHHGLWLDNGELQHLMEWKRVGGQLLHEHEQQQAKKHRRSDIDNSLAGVLQSPVQQSSMDLETNLLDVLAFVAGKIF